MSEEISESQSEPNLVRLSDGSYLQWDKKEGYFRVAFYERRSARSSDLLAAISLAMKKPSHNSKVKKITEYISETKEYAATCA